MTQFAIFATLMIVVVAVMVLPPLWLGLRAPKAKTNRNPQLTSVVTGAAGFLGSHLSDRFLNRLRHLVHVGRTKEQRRNQIRVAHERAVDADDANTILHR